MVHLKLLLLALIQYWFFLSLMRKFCAQNLLQVILQGILTSGASLSVTFRRGPPFKDNLGFMWLIHGEKAEIRLTAKGPSLQMYDDTINITVHNFDTDTVETLHWDRQFQNLPGFARNVAIMYEAFANGEVNKYPDFEYVFLLELCYLASFS